MPNEMTNNIDLELVNQRNEEALDFITKPPHWLLRSGMMLLFMAIALIFVLSYFFRYPEKINGTGYMTAATPPIALKANSNGYIQSFLAKNGQILHAGDLIMKIQNTSNEGDVTKLNEWISHSKHETELLVYITTSPLPDSLQLGGLQTLYATLQNKITTLIRLEANKIYVNQTKTIDNEVGTLQKLNSSVQKEMKIYQKEYALGKKHLERNENLYADKAISMVELEQTRKDVLQQERSYENMERSILQNKVRAEQLNFEKNKILKSRSDEVESLITDVSALINTLSNQINEWRYTYEVRAPFDGTYYSPEDIKQYTALQANQAIGYLLPTKNNARHIYAQVPATSAGKIIVGQKTIIKLDPYPYKEYGMIVSKVSAKSALPLKDDKGNSYYELKIHLPDTIHTDYGRTIPYLPFTPCGVEVITKDRSILERMLDQVTSSLRSNG